MNRNKLHRNLLLCCYDEQSLTIKPLKPQEANHWRPVKSSLRISGASLTKSFLLESHSAEHMERVMERA